MKSSRKAEVSSREITRGACAEAWRAAIDSAAHPRLRLPGITKRLPQRRSGLDCFNRAA